MKGIVYVIAIEDVNDYIDKINPNLIFVSTIEEFEKFNEETCKEIVANSQYPKSGIYSIDEFVAEFNNDIDSIFNSDTFFIRIF